MNKIINRAAADKPLKEREIMRQGHVGDVCERCRAQGLVQMLPHVINRASDSVGDIRMMSRRGGAIGKTVARGDYNLSAWRARPGGIDSKERGLVVRAT